MKPNPLAIALAAPVVAASYIAFHPGVAFAENRLAKLGRQTSFPKSGSFTIDPMHTSIGFEIGHLGISRVQGRFDKFSGKLFADSSDPSKSSVEFTAQTDSVDTNVAPRDADLRSPNFFDVAKFPELTFKSTHIANRGRGYVADGDLTIKGVTRSVSIPFTAFGPVKDPFGGTRVGIVSQPILVHRHEFGMNADMGPVSDDVTVRLSLEATLDKK